MEEKKSIGKKKSQYRIINRPAGEVKVTTADLTGIYFVLTMGYKQSTYIAITVIDSSALVR